MHLRKVGSFLSVAIVLFTLAFSGAPAAVSAQAPLAELTLRPGEAYFRLDGKPTFIFTRNVTGITQLDFDTILDWCKNGGSILARIQLDSLGLGYTKAGEIDLAWAARWERVFDKAAADGIHLLLVFSGWFDWNGGPGYSTWASNPLNRANGGPAKAPGELFQKDSVTQTLWLRWVRCLVARWQARKNIAAWEILSEVNLASGTTERTGIEFAERTADVIRTADPAHRPLTASLADIGEWPGFYKSGALDFINIHPYPSSGQLDTTIIANVRLRLKNGKPVMIGESGLSALTPDSRPPTLTTAANALTGIRHAVWAALVAGAMNGRMLYWEDSFAVYFPALGFPFMKKYAAIESAAARFIKDVDLTGFAPLAVRSGTKITGAAIGKDGFALGWFRDARCEPPDWNVKSEIAGQVVTINIPGATADWRVYFYDPFTGAELPGSTAATRKGNGVTVSLPDFTDDIAFKMYGLE